MLKFLQIIDLIHFLGGSRELSYEGQLHLTKEYMRLNVSLVINEEKNPEGSTEKRQNCREQSEECRIFICRLEQLISFYFS